MAELQRTNGACRETSLKVAAVVEAQDNKSLDQNLCGFRGEERNAHMLLMLYGMNVRGWMVASLLAVKDCC